MTDMDLRVFTEPQQGADYYTLLAVAWAAEKLGFDAFFCSDHYLAMGDCDGLPGPTDAWITLAGLARETRRIRLGTLMTAGTFRLPGPLAIQVAQVDQMSGGRVEFGLGSGWFEEEHRAYGIPFPKDKFARLEEQLKIVTGLWATPTGERFQFNGTYYRLVDSPALPKPTQARVPILVGGLGTVRTPRLAGRFADEFNLPFTSPRVSKHRFGLARKAAVEAGRNPEAVRFSNVLVACVGKDDAEVGRRAEAIGPELLKLREPSLLYGSPAEVVDKIGHYQQAGASRIYLQIVDLHDIDHLELISSQVLGQLS